MATLTPASVAPLGFASVPHAPAPEKLAADCRRYSLFATCGQHAMAKDLAPAEA